MSESSGMIEGGVEGAVAGVVVRPAAEADLPQVGRLAGELVRMHHATDPRRFLLIDGVEQGYERWLAREIKRREAVVLVAARAPGAGAPSAASAGASSAANPGAQSAGSDEILGYTYGALEGRDWNLLLDTHGALHDVYVAAGARRGGVGRRLVEGMVDALGKLGAPRVLLSTMVSNEAAQRVFRACGFRSTMLEMTRDPA